MRKLLFGAAIALIAGSGGFSTADEKQAAPRQIQFMVRVFEGDPLGSPEAGTVKVLADTRVTTLEQRPCTLVMGGETSVPAAAGKIEYVRVGRSFECLPGSVDAGKVRLDITFANTKVASQSAERLQLQTESTRTLVTVKEGEVVKLRWPGGTPDKQVWAELSLAIVGSDNEKP